MKRDQQIAKQIEFYLSNANLRKDNFFQEQLRKSPYVPLTVFLNCNRVKKLTKSTEDVKLALKENSKAIVLNEAGDACARADHDSFNLDKFLKSKAPETLFVANLPLDIDEDKLQNLFTNAYVNFKAETQSRKWILPVAFVDFDSDKELNAFLDKDNVSELPLFTEEEKLDKSVMYALKKSQFDKYVKQVNEVFGVNSNAMAHFSRKENMMKKYDNIEELVKDWLNDNNFPVTAIFSHSRHNYVEFESVEVRDKAWEAYVQKKTLKYPKQFQPRMEKLEPIHAALIRFVIATQGIPEPTAAPSKVSPRSNKNDRNDRQSKKRKQDSDEQERTPSPSKKEKSPSPKRTKTTTMDDE